MQTQELDYDDILRRALRAAAESVEPAADGLERIRGRVSARHLSPFMLLSQFLDYFFRPILILLESSGAGALSGLAKLRVRLARGEAYGSSGAGLGPVHQRPRAAHRSQSPATGLRTRLGPAVTRLGPAASWLKPVLAVGGAVAIVVAGVFALGQVQQAITPANQFSHSTTTHHGSPAGPSAPAVVPAPRSATPSFAPASSPAPRPTASCSPSSKPKASAPASSATPTPSVSISPTGAPTGSSSPYPTATPTDTWTYPFNVNAGELSAVSIRRLTTPCASAPASAGASVVGSAAA